MVHFLLDGCYQRQIQHPSFFRRGLYLFGFSGGSYGKEAACNCKRSWVRSLGWEDYLEKGMATHSSILVWKIPWTKEPGGLQSMGWQGVRHRATNAFTFFLSQFSSVTQAFPTLWDHKDGSAPGVPVHHQLPELAQTHVQWLRDAIQLPLSSPSLPAFNFSQHLGLFQWVSSSHQAAKVLELQLLHQSFQWIFRMISYRSDWFDLLAVQGILKNFLQHNNLKASILQCSAFFMVQISHPYMTTGKPIIWLDGPCWQSNVSAF